MGAKCCAVCCCSTLGSGRVIQEMCTSGHGQCFSQLLSCSPFEHRGIMARLCRTRGCTMEHAACMSVPDLKLQFLHLPGQGKTKPGFVIEVPGLNVVFVLLYAICTHKLSVHRIQRYVYTGLNLYEPVSGRLNLM